MGFLGDIFGGGGGGLLGMFGGGGGGGGGGSSAGSGGGLLDFSTASSATTANLTATETAADSYNETSNLAHNISGSANTYNVYRIGTGDNGNLAEDFGLGLGDNLNPLPSSATATPGNKKKFLVIAGLAVLAGVLWWLFFRRK